MGNSLISRRVFAGQYESEYISAFIDEGKIRVHLDGNLLFEADDSETARTVALRMVGEIERSLIRTVSRARKDHARDLVRRVINVVPYSKREKLRAIVGEELYRDLTGID